MWNECLERNWQTDTKSEKKGKERKKQRERAIEGKMRSVGNIKK